MAQEIHHQRYATDKVLEHIASRDKTIVTIGGDLGVGKTETLTHLSQVLTKAQGYDPFLVSLSTHEFASGADWQLDPSLTDEQNEQSLLQSFCQNFGITYIQSLEPNYQQEYMAKAIAGQKSPYKRVLLIDGIERCNTQLRRKVEQELITPNLVNPRMAVVMTSSNKNAYLLSGPEAKDTKHVQLAPIYQVGIQIPKRIQKVVNRILETSIPESDINLRQAILDISKLNQPFREGDVNRKIYGKELTTRVFNLLRTQDLLHWDDTGESTGYRIDSTILAYLANLPV